MSEQTEEQFSGIKSWSEDDRPREKLLHKGAASLSDAELLAILIGSGTVKRTALDLARDLLNLSEKNLSKLSRMNLSELQQVKGVGVARAITISAALELGRRRQMEPALERKIIRGFNDVKDLLLPLLQDQAQEVFCVLYLGTSGNLLRHEFISMGGLTATVADIRIILKNALLQQATRIIVAHNHPSGNPRPSEADKQLTQKLKSAAASMDIELLDHVIVAGQQATSFVHEGLL
jgi:DNA repair protein RadC